MSDKTADLAHRISEITTRISGDLEALSKLIVEAAHEADSKFTEIFNRQTPQLKHHLNLPYSVRSVGQHLRIRSTSISQLMDVLANVQYIRDMETIEGKVLPWRELLRDGKIIEASEVLGHYDRLKQQEIMAISGFFTTFGK